MAPKVTIIGGGSSSFVPVLIRRLMQSEALEAARVSLMDIDEGRLGVMQALADKLVESEASDIRVTSTLDQREALVGADFVIAAIAEGGMDAWAGDLEIPGRYGIVMPIGDSLGPGGVMRAFRNAPALAQVARNAAEVAPGRLHLQLHEPRADRGARHARRGAGGQDLQPLLVRRAREQPRVAGRAGGRQARGHRDAARRRRHQPLRVDPGTAPDRRHATRCRWCASGRPSRSSSGRSTPTASCRTAGSTGRSSSRRCSASRALCGHGAGREDALRHHDPRHGLRACARRRSGGRWRRVDGAGCRARDARRPAGRRRGRGHRGHRPDRGDPDQRQHHADRERARTRARSRTCPTARWSRSTRRSTPTACGRSTRGRCPSRWPPTCAATTTSSSTSSRPRSPAIARPPCTHSCSSRRSRARLDLDETQALLDEMLAANAAHLPLFQ